MDVDFCDDITFITGLNGSGKTTALRLLMALLEPNIEELGSINYEEAMVVVTDSNQEISIKSVKSIEGIELSVSTVGQKMLVSTAEIEILQDARRRDEAHSPLMEKFSSKEIYMAIRSLSTPMFLGLDRRFIGAGVGIDEALGIRRRSPIGRRYFQDDFDFKNSNTTAALIDANMLVSSRMQEIRADQELLDGKLRTDFFAKAFEYNPGVLDVLGAKIPSRDELTKYRLQLGKIEKAAEDLKIPVPEIKLALSKFFEKMSDVVDSLDKVNDEKDSKKRSMVGNNRRSRSDLFSNQDYIEWVINKPQADRVLEHLELLETYIEKRNALRDPVERFLGLVNEFFKETEKKIILTSNGQLRVDVVGLDSDRPITALSSGEKQILVMLAHLSLNKSLSGSGVFIVDEPEVSLHIGWQEKFVDAIQSANPKVQLILATHSPAIILDRVAPCRTLN